MSHPTGIMSSPNCYGTIFMLWKGSARPRIIINAIQNCLLCLLIFSILDRFQHSRPAEDFHEGQLSLFRLLAFVWAHFKMSKENLLMSLTRYSRSRAGQIFPDEVKSLKTAESIVEVLLSYNQQDSFLPHLEKTENLR
jgi:hypothetical protein